ncbi:hypothetical protein IFM89_025585 [Coptis chinensis]|uniref:serine C-palmitoyltransferase n=1 Tax=Coptis chinensis TaxID=261450 RepID=A0A835LEJ6_9MAGN|nr:hypothetical protein IFM89_025585 [Coptis chinensis]
MWLFTCSNSCKHLCFLVFVAFPLNPTTNPDAESGYGVGHIDLVKAVDSTNNLPLECVIRRVFEVLKGMINSVTQQGEGSAIQKRMFSNLAQMRATHLWCLEVLVEILTEHYGVPVDKIDIITASMGYALATDGGFCTGSVRVVDHQRLSSSGYVFSASLPPYLASAAISAIDILEENHQLLGKLRGKCCSFVERILLRAEVKLVETFWPFERIIGSLGN